MDYRTIKELSKLWKMEETKITYYIRTGKIEGAIKSGKQWLIPNDTKKPIDGRFSSNKILTKKPLPIGISDFKEACSNYYYIDKTLFIKDIIDNQRKITLFTRPRRFGKTLNMNMIKTYFEKCSDDTSVYFKNLNIWKMGSKYQEYQGKYPVIYLSFKDAKKANFKEVIDHLRYIICFEFKRNLKNLNLHNLDQLEIDYINKVNTLTLNQTELELSLKILSKILYDSTLIKPMIIIDEYDTPIQEGYLNDYYDEIIGFMRNLFSNSLKDNEYLSFGFLSGILRIAKESLFSGLNNLSENTILSTKYNEYFGFTKEEVVELLSYYDCIDKYDEVISWYDGYIFGNKEIFNPWSVLSYIDEECIPQTYWQNTGTHGTIKQILLDSPKQIKENILKLMNQNEVTVPINLSVVYPDVRNHPESVYSFLLMAGYLKPTNTYYLDTGAICCSVKIPNKEISCVYGNEILLGIEDDYISSTALLIQADILINNVANLQNDIKTYLEESISYFDTEKESFYQGFMLGLTATINNLYKVKSNKESGLGRYDIMLNPINKNLPGIIIELKVLKDSLNSKEDIDKKLEELALTAINQIDEKNYEIELKHDGIKTIIKYGIAFYKKQIKIITKN